MGVFIILLQIRRPILSQNLPRFVMLCICLCRDTPSENTGPRQNYKTCPVPLRKNIILVAYVVIDCDTLQ